MQKSDVAHLRTSPSRLLRLIATFMTLFVTASLTIGLTPAAAAGVPNLRVAKATVDRSSVTEGGSFRVTHTVKNSGTAKAGSSTTRFYLAVSATTSLSARKSSRTNPRMSPYDIRLSGTRSVTAISAGRSLSLSAATVKVPIGTAAGTYDVLACSDDLGRVKERYETDNCLAAGTRIKVRAASGSADLVVQSFADTFIWPEDENDALWWMKIFCDAKHPTKTFTLSGARSSARAFLSEKAGADALKALNDSGQAGTVVKAQELAGVAVAEGSPGLALAALLRATELEPNNAGHLVNAAALATSVGLPNEALAFLDAALTKDGRRPAMGVSRHAIALTVRGQALVQTGRYSAAESMFKAAKAAEPMLSEADAGLANVRACRKTDDDDIKAARFVRKSRQRSQVKDTTTPTEEVVRPAPVIDRTHGKATPLRQLPIAETPAQAVAMHPVYQGIENGFAAEIDAHNREDAALNQHLRATDDARTEAEKERRDSILYMVHGVSSEADIAALRRKAFAKVDLITEHRERFFGGGTGEVPSTYRTLSDEAFAACQGSEDPNCWIRQMNSTCRPAFSAAHTQWRGMMSELQTLDNQLMAAQSTRMSAYASNLLDEEAHRLAILSIEETETAIYAGIVQQGQFWTHYAQLYETECVEPLPAEVLVAPTAEAGATSGPCPKDVAAMNLVANLGPTKVKITCEKVTQEISAEVLPLLHAFAEVSYDFRTGSVTVFAGSKGEGKLGIVEGGFKSGMYLTSDGQGAIKDAGWRVGPSASVTEGAAEYQVYEDNVDLSFVSALSTSP